MTILYFTATGNSLQVAKKIGGTLLSIPQMIIEGKNKFEDETIGLVFPIYGFGLPIMVGAFLEEAVFKMRYSFAIGTYGGMSGATMFNMAKFSAKRGIKFDYMVDLLMVDNYLHQFEMSEQIKKLPEKKTEENLKRIISDIHNRKTNSPVAPLPARIMSAVAKGNRKRLLDPNMAQSFIVNDTCTLCKTCSKVCPTGNVTVDGKVIFSDRCESCFSCVHNCTSNAIHLKNEKSAIRFRNSEVTLKEIQDANCQI